mmetsp:Transcript_11874/g.18233  ORF Transcript_11874/g.18233 Transcript_11874/m.18233 type:complete len:122 (-) Transcript_11874:272-637(-)
MEYAINAIDTGSRTTPYNAPGAEECFESNATIATLAPARRTLTCNQAKKVRSFAKKTFGSIFTGADRGSMTGSITLVAEDVAAKAFDFLETFVKKLNNPLDFFVGVKFSIRPVAVIRRALN